MHIIMLYTYLLYLIFRKQTNNSSYNYVDGPIICIGDFDDGYNMPPPIQLNTETIIDDEINVSRYQYYYIYIFFIN